MTLLHREDSPALRLDAKEVAYKSDVSTTIKSMLQTMHAHKKAGLAANQIGILRRIIIITIAGKPKVLINPTITKQWGGKSFKREGCLSFPGTYVRKVRWRRVTITGFNESWEPVTYKLGGKSAQCAQHEVDHLNGITII